MSIPTSLTLARHAHDRDQPARRRARMRSAAARVARGTPTSSVKRMTVPYRSAIELTVSSLAGGDRVGLNR
jgi:hypothetical protein